MSIIRSAPAMILGLLAASAAAQIPTPISVPPLPPGPAWERYLLEDSWVPALMLGLAALVAGITFLRRQQATRAITSFALLAAAAATVMMVGILVKTPREIVRAHTESMVFAAGRGDRAVLSEILAPDARLTASFAGEAGSRQEILDLVDRYATERAQVRDHAVLELQASRDGPSTARTQVLVRVWAANVPVFSWWRLDFRRSDGGLWTCRRIEMLWISSDRGGP
ncbi:MAG: hypothetical protein AMXMBFR58_30760 [Phycisphaerae bacterium]